MAGKNDKALAPVEDKNTAVGAVIDYGGDAGVGYEGTSNADFSIPFLSILQAQSPQIVGQNPVEDARPGMLYNTVTEECFSGKDGLEFIPAFRDHCYVEWVPRDDGGGFVARHNVDSAEVLEALKGAEFGKYKIGKNDLIETFYIYGLVAKGDGNLEPAVLAFTSTKIKVYKKLMTRLNMFTLSLPDGRKQRPPLFAHRLLLKVVPDKNKKGNFFNFSLESAGATMQESLLAPSDERFQAAKGLADLVKSGAAKADHNSQGRAGDGGADGEAGVGDKPPF